MTPMETYEPKPTETAVGSVHTGAEEKPVPLKSQLATLRERLSLLWIAGLVLTLDQVSKATIEAAMPLYSSYAPFPAIAALFRITHVPNTGTAFGLFQNGSLFFGIMAVLVAVGIVYYNFVLEGGQQLLRVALGLQLGGALGNLFDRLRLGHVTDFLDFGPWPIFNLADTAIVAGAVLLGWLVLQEAREEKRAKELAAQSAEDAD